MTLAQRAESNSTEERLCWNRAGCVCCSTINSLQVFMVIEPSPACLLVAGKLLLLDQGTPCLLQ